MDHLWLPCPTASKLWNMVFNLFGVQWVMPLRVLDMLSSWQGLFEHHQYKRIWEAIPHCLMWCL